MAILSKADILKVSDIQRELVAVPEWGGDVWVKGLTGAERGQYEKSILTIRGKDQTINMAHIRAKLASLSICDEAGARLFTDADVEALDGKSAAALERVFTVAMRLSGLGEQDVKELATEIAADPFAVSPTD